MKCAHDGRHALYLIFGLRALGDRNSMSIRYLHPGFVAMPRSFAVSRTRLHPPFLTSAPNRLFTSHSALLGVSAQIHSVTIPASGSRLHIHSYNILGSVAEMVATVSNVVGMIVSGIMTSLSACRA